MAHQLIKSVRTLFDFTLLVPSCGLITSVCLGIGFSGCSVKDSTSPAAQNSTQQNEPENQSDDGAVKTVDETSAAAAAQTLSVDSSADKPSVSVQPGPNDESQDALGTSTSLETEHSVATAADTGLVLAVELSASILKPGNGWEAAALLDLRSLSPLRLNQMSSHNELELDYTSDADSQTALDHHRQSLETAGWELPADAQNAIDSGNYKSRLFVKDDFIINLAIVDYSDSLTGVTVKHLGNIDARILPMFDEAILDKESTAWGAMYKTQNSLEDVTNDCRKRMAELGWMEYETTAETSELPYETGGSRVIPFVQNGVTCYLNVSPPGIFGGGKTSPAYFLTGLIAKGVSVPVGATQVKLDRGQGSVEFISNGPLSEAHDQVQAMAKQLKWVEKEGSRSESARIVQVTFRVDEKTLFRVKLEERGFSRTHVRILRAEDVSQEDLLAEASVAKFDAPEAAQASETTEATEDVSTTNQILADEFPLPPGASLSSNSEPMMVTSDLSPEKVSEFYVQAMSKLGWVRDEAQSDVVDDMHIICFTKSEHDQLTIVARKPDGNFPSIIIHGTGIRWPETSAADDALALASEFIAGDFLDEGSGSKGSQDFGFAEGDFEVENEGWEEESESAEGSAEIRVLPAEWADKATNKAACEAALGSTTVNLNHGVAYQTQSYGETETVILLSEKELPKQELLLQLAQSGEISLFDLDLRGRLPQNIEIRLSGESGQDAWCSCYVNGASLNFSSEKLKLDVKSDKGWIRGEISLTEPKDVFGDEFTFSAKFDLGGLNPNDLDPQFMEEQNRPLQMVDGIPVPVLAEESFREGGQYSTTAHATIESDLESVVKLYRDGMQELGFEENEKAARIEKESARLVFTGAQGEIQVSAKPKLAEIELSVSLRDVAQAKKDKIIPAAGKGKLLFGNAFESDIVITIGENQYPIKAGQGAKDPTTAPSYDVAPGNYTLTISVPGKTDKKEKVKVDEGTTWGAIVLPDGDTYVDRLY